MENRAMKYEKPVLDGFCGWDAEFAVGGSQVITDPCIDGSYQDPDGDPDW